jgi:hypothetical protein
VNDAGPYIVRWLEVPERFAHQLLVLRRAGVGQVEWLDLARVTGGQGMDWRWVRTEPGGTLEPWQGVVLELPTEALEAVRAALEATLGLPPATAEARVLREAWERERGYVSQLLSMLAEVVKRTPSGRAPPPEAEP